MTFYAPEKYEGKGNGEGSVVVLSPGAHDFSSSVLESLGSLADEFVAYKRIRVQKKSTRKAWRPGPCLWSS